jgi:hypothetical protein
MRLMLPIGIKIKNYYEKINITGQLQTNIERELNEFYKNIPLNNDSFDRNEKNQKNEKTQKNKTKKVKIKIHPL